VTASETKVIAAPIVEVTILEDRAQVRRRAKVAVAGACRLIVEGVAPALVDKTLLVTATGARVVSAACERSLAPHVEGKPGPSGASTQVATLEAEKQQLVERVAAVQRALVLAESEAAAVIELAKAALAELADAAAWGEPPTPEPDGGPARAFTGTEAAPPALRGAAARLAALDGREQAARRKASTLGGEHDELTAELGRLDVRIARARELAGREAARVAIEVVAGAAMDAELTIEYVVPGAAWRPYHRARLDPASGALTLRTDACVWQATGEDWAAAALIFSTERPSLGTEPPDLADDVLRVRRRPEQVVVETRDLEIDTTGLGREGRGARVEEVPGIDDGGVGTRMRGAAPATIPADGRPYRVLLGERQATASVGLVTMPERGLAVHVRAAATNPGPGPILAGPVDLLLASGYVGRGVIGFIAEGEKLELGFGPDAELRVHREVERETEAGGVLSGWNATEVRIAVRVSNLGETVRKVRVTERVPISEVEQVKVEVAPSEAWQLEDDAGRREEITVVTQRSIDPDKGMISWLVELPPRERRAVALKYTIKSQKGVVGV
jgi:uncharacterized protein (TIGR02231 family)